ncbi:hypothetical protein [Methylocystis hirsuta]|uniref:hypothetical protein n=1 Tax=Methylocystis hirsuta TaxID=369798 RepID=UPI0011CDCA6E|nr:hypothetical protein [Methylocystis hirsuta]
MTQKAMSCSSVLLGDIKIEPFWTGHREFEAAVRNLPTEEKPCGDFIDCQALIVQILNARN